MVEENLPVPVDPSAEGKSFEQSKSVNEHGAEYWSARDLQPLLGYNHWRSFEKAIAKAITSCQQSGNEPNHHFACARKVVALGSGSEREVVDFHLSRFACYMTQTREKLAKEGIHGQEHAIRRAPASRQGGARGDPPDWRHHA